MPKRMTDTNVWNKRWFGDLSPSAKLLFFYLKDSSDHAGFIDFNLKLFSFHIGMEVNEKTLSELSNFVEKINDTKLFIPEFVNFQYSVKSYEDLNPNNKVHLSVLKLLKKNDIIEYFDAKNKGDSKGLDRGYGSPLEGVKDKDKDKDKEMNKEKDQEDLFKEKPEKKKSDKEVFSNKCSEYLKIWNQHSPKRRSFYAETSKLKFGKMILQREKEFQNLKEDWGSKIEKLPKVVFSQNWFSLEWAFERSGNMEKLLNGNYDNWGNSGFQPQKPKYESKATQRANSISNIRRYGEQGNLTQESNIEENELKPNLKPEYEVFTDDITQ